MKNITLQTAVQLSINLLLSTYGSFSAFDVTKQIRQDVDVAYKIESLDVDFDSNDDPFSVVNHSEVRDLVVELFENGLFTATKGYQTAGAVTYIVYTSTDPVAQTVAPAAAVAPTTPTVPQVDPLVTKINAYLNNNGPRSIKQIQSALKINGVTCADIAKKIGFNQTAVLTNSISTVIVNP